MLENLQARHSSIRLTNFFQERESIIFEANNWFKPKKAYATMRTKSVDDEPDQMSIESGNPKVPNFKNYRNNQEKFSSVTS